MSYNKKRIKADKLFNDQPLYLIRGYKTNGQNMILPDIQSELEEKYKKEFSDKILIWGGNYLHSMLLFNYVCTEIVIYEDDCKIYKLEKADSETKETF